MRITEYVGNDGVVSSNYDHARLSRPRAGDLILNDDGSYGMVEKIDDGKVHVVERCGSAFLGRLSDLTPERQRKDRGIYVSISGGPFKLFELSRLEPTMRVAGARFWNWGDNFAGADQGCDYTLNRPVFKVN